ncbi:TcpE family conjugal transfer membrane protein [Nonomuraea glycinis]|uniref:TcpE family conjugal transfer membrane protein n=1 Tax=Nonomuraea glycinis TaxID=2047744 RepID=UPI0033BCB277
MDLPTYTNIWRIEKRLYKLYDLRLPMPLPIVWIGVFVGVVVPWSLLLWLVGVPVEMPWHVLYLVPPGIVTWLSTRPVIEGKRLTELLESQLRYLGQPRAWYRLAPGAEPETISFSGRVWRVSPARVRVKSTRKARQTQRKRSAAQRINGPRQVRPAVAAAAVAAAQAPVAESATTRTGWGSRTRPGAAAPALGTTALALPPSRQDHELVRESRAEARGTTETPAEPRTATDPRSGQETPARSRTGRDSQDAARSSHGAVRDGRDTPAALRLVRGTSEDAPTGRDDARHEPAGDPAERAGGRTSRQTASGKPIDTEALRRLRKLAASADAPSESSALPGGEDEQAADEHGRDDEVARNQHRKGRPPRLGPALLLPDVQGGWSPLNPDSTPMKLSRPLRGRGPDSELPALPVHHDDAVPSASAQSEQVDPAQHDDPVRPERVDPGQHDDPIRPEPNDEGLQRVPTGSARGDDAGSAPHTQEEDAAERSQGVVEGPVGAPEDEEAPPTPSARQEVTLEALRPLESLPSTTRQPSAGPEQPESAEHEPSESVQRRPSERVDLRLRSVEPLRPAQERESDEHSGSGEDRQSDEDRRAERRRQSAEQQQAEREHERERSVIGLEAREGAAAGSAVEQAGERLRSVGQPQAPERREVAAGVPVPRTGEREPRVRRVESVVGRDSGGWRRIAQVVVGGSGVRTDGSEIDEARARGVFGGSRRIVVLGCTGGAGQSTTALMLGHTLARYRDDRVVAVDAAPGGGSLTSRVEQETPETLTSLLAGLHGVSGYLTMRGYTTRTASGLEVVGADGDAEAEQRLADRDLFSDRRLGEALSLLDRHYKLSVIDPAASLAARVLPYADQLVLVLPASEEAPEAVAMTYEWLDGHGCADLRRRAVMVVNGVSRRSMADVEQAEAVASGRCRAIVRVPWEDGLAPGGDEVVDPGQLRAAGRRAYLALAGVVVAGFTAQRIRPSEEELASDPPGTRIGER